MGCDLSVVVFQITEKVGFQIPEAGFRIPMVWILDSKGKKMLDSGFPYMGRDCAW